MSPRAACATLAAVALLVLAPLLLRSDFHLGLLTQILIYGLCALSLNVLVGYGGLTSLGHAAYLGIAAYAMPLLVTGYGFGQLSAVLLTLAATTVIALVFGILALRAVGLGFLMITLALGQICWGIAYRWVGLTGGDNGMPFAHRPAPFGIDLEPAGAFYYFTLTVFLVAALCLWRLARSPFGASLEGTRDQPRRMRMLGYHVGAIQLAAYVIAGFWAGVSGILFVAHYKFVSPAALSLQQSAEILLMTILGGASSFAGPLAGAVVITLVKNVASSYVERWNALLGAIFVVCVVLMPQGIVPGLRRLLRPRRRGLPAAAARVLTRPAAIEGRP